MEGLGSDDARGDGERLMALVVANGKPRTVNDGSTIADLLAEIGWRQEWVVVEYNGEALARARYAQVRLSAGDRLEIVRAVAGG